LDATGLVGLEGAGDAVDVREGLFVGDGSNAGKSPWGCLRVDTIVTAQCGAIAIGKLIGLWKVSEVWQQDCKEWSRCVERLARHWREFTSFNWIGSTKG
jgi:hypothetical protein